MAISVVVNVAVVSIVTAVGAAAADGVAIANVDVCNHINTFSQYRTTAKYLNHLHIADSATGI